MLYRRIVGKLFGSIPFIDDVPAFCMTLTFGSVCTVIPVNFRGSDWKKNNSSIPSCIKLFKRNALTPTLTSLNQLQYILSRYIQWFLQQNLFTANCCCCCYAKRVEWYVINMDCIDVDIWIICYTLNVYTPDVAIGDADDDKTVGCWRKIAVLIGEPTTWAVVCWDVAIRTDWPCKWYSWTNFIRSNFIHIVLMWMSNEFDYLHCSAHERSM